MGILDIDPNKFDPTQSVMEEMAVSRRSFLRTAAIGATALAAGQLFPALGATDARDEIKDLFEAGRPKRLPRWRGFNLIDMAETNMCYHDRSNEDFVIDISEDDFRWIRDWGFDFVRVCLNYRVWATGDDLYSVNEERLAMIDRVVNLGQKYNIHVSLDMHRAPGKWEIPERTPPLILWRSQEALDALCFHWKMLASRYRGISNRLLSFDLLNEPETMVSADSLDPTQARRFTREEVIHVTRAMVLAVREEDPRRLILVEGPNWGRTHLPEIDDLDVCWSFHNWDPHVLTHYGRPENGYPADRTPLPVWPPVGSPCGVDWHRRHMAPWFNLARQGVGVHMGEMGGNKNCPHELILPWLRDLLAALKEEQIGWSMFSLRGKFGLVDSRRKDVAYEDWYGHKLDRAMLSVLQKG